MASAAPTHGAEHVSTHALQERAAAELGIELVVGTEIMRDTAHTTFVHAAGSGQVLVPQPDRNEQDPLNWSRLWKLAVVGNQLIFVLTTNLPSLGIAPMTPFMIAKYAVSPARVNLYTGATVLSLGYANFFIVPAARIWGRRAAAIVCGTIVLASLLWCALATSDSSFMGARILLGIGSAANESLMGMMVADMYFVHERATFTTAYIASYFFGVVIGPVISGTVASVYNVSAFFWVSFAVVAFSMILTVFALPETRWNRARVRDEGATITQSDKPAEDSDKPSVEHVDATELVEGLVGRGKPARYQFALWASPDWTALKLAHFARDFIIPVRLLFLPITFWAAFNGWPANAVLGVNIVQSPVLSSLYGFTPSQVGNSNLALLVGAVTGLLTAGPFSDWLSIRLTKRNNDVREAEMRLISLIPFCIIGTLGLLIIALGIANTWPWESVVIFGFFCIGLQVVSVGGIAFAYALDCYPACGGEFLVIATVAKNTNGFGYTFWLGDLGEKSGFATAIWAVFGLTVGFYALTIPLFFFGKRFRRWTNNSSLHRLDTA